jgi:uncharacterized membrane protein
VRAEEAAAHHEGAGHVTTTAAGRTPFTAGALLGIGLGGFVDGIVLHELLQWHHMLSAKVSETDVAGLKVNMFFDGAFHAFAWLATVVGVALLWRTLRATHEPASTRAFVGAVLFGWGLFNVVEGAIDHQLLGLHHVHPGARQPAWDAGFLVLGLLLVAVGAALGWGRRDTVPPPRPARVS